MEFSTILKELRESREITQEELAKQLRVSRPTIAGYETKHRQPDYDKLITLANIFHVSVDYLLTGSNKKHAEYDSTLVHSEKTLNRKVLNAYKKLSLGSKEDVLKYIRLLELKENSK